MCTEKPHASIGVQVVFQEALGSLLHSEFLQNRRLTSLCCRFGEARQAETLIRCQASFDRFCGQDFTFLTLVSLPSSLLPLFIESLSPPSVFRGERLVIRLLSLCDSADSVH